MASLTFDERFFESTRGRIVGLLRHSSKTVNDLASALDLTDNAVRSHLLSLERDRLVESAGTIKGVRKPHVVYKLTDEARKRFPRAYDSLLNRLLDVLKHRMPKGAVAAAMREVGSKIARSKPIDENASTRERVGIAIKSLEALGGAAEATTEDDRILIQSESCPFAEAVAEHPEVCKVAESMIEEIVGKKTNETCDRASAPKCRFAIDTREDA